MTEASASGLAAIRRRNGERLANNQRRLLAAIQQQRWLPLRPQPLEGCSGHVEHYYHFLFDLLLPLHTVLAGAPAAHGVVLPQHGPLGERLLELFPGRVRLDADPSPAAVPLLGMNPKGTRLPPDLLRSFADEIRQRIASESAVAASRVLLIERAPPVPFYRMRAQVPGSGSERRSIVNHRELAQALSALLRPALQNVVLEHMDWAEQIRCFSAAPLVIGQHGAGLANAIWMPPGAAIVEICDRPRGNFSSLASQLDMHYVRYQQPGRHPRIDPIAFCNWLREQRLPAGVSLSPG